MFIESCYVIDHNGNDLRSCFHVSACISEDDQDQQPKL